MVEGRREFILAATSNLRLIGFADAPCGRGSHLEIFCDRLPASNKLRRDMAELLVRAVVTL